MAIKTNWASKITALLTGGNLDAALAQIKVAPSVKDLQQLRKQLTENGHMRRYPQIDQATQDQLSALSSPRLHRSP